MTVINTNINALYSQMALSQNAKSQSTAMRELSTGKRINSAADDAAGLAISTRMTSQIKGLNQAVSNSNDAINLIQTANGATSQITTMLQRMRELAVQAANDTNSDSQRSYLDLEFQQLKQQIVQISNDTEWNGFPILNGSAGERVGIQPVYKTVSSSITQNAPPFALGTYGNGLTSNNSSVGNMTATQSSPTGTLNLNVAGQFSFNVNATPAVTSASFTSADGTVTSIPASCVTADSVNGTVTLDVGSLYNNNHDLANYLFSNSNDPLSSSSGTITISQTTAAGAAVPFSAAPTGDIISVAANFPTLPAMKANDLVINGVTVGSSLAASDNLSVANNAAGSAIAKVAAINAVTAQTGVAATVNPNLMTGAAMIATQPSVSGTISINGYTTPIINTTANNTRQSRTDVINAINFITQYTGVKAIDTNSDTQGITLIANDGRNIQVNFNSNSSNTAFSAATGLKQGIQAGTYSLESSINTPINITTSTTGNILTSGLQVADYTSQINSSVSTAPRTAVTVSGGQTSNSTAYLSGFTAQVASTSLTVEVGSPPVSITTGNVTPATATMSDLASSLQAALRAADNGSTDLSVTTDAASGSASGGLIITSASGRPVNTPSSTGSASANPPVPSTLVSDVSFGTPPSVTDFIGAKLTVGSTILNVPALTGSFAPAGTTMNDLATALSAALTAAAGGAYTVTVSSNATASSSSGGLVMSAVDANNNPVSLSNFALVPNLSTNVQPLQANDLVLNGIPVGSAKASDDSVSNTQTANSLAQASGIATAAAINAVSLQTGVKAIANPVIINGSAAVDVTSYPADPTKTPNLFINGVGVYVDLSSSTATDRLSKVMAAVNPLVGKTGVVATENSAGGISLTASDGRNVSVWYNNSITGTTSVNTHVSAASFGLAVMSGSQTVDPPGVTGTGQPLSTFTAGSTVYGGVTLVSPKPIDVEAGTNGFGPNSNFSGQGFKVGVVGGLVDAAVAKMTPPRTGRLSFQVGSDANQTVTIDLPDFGPGGPITSQITWDASMPNLAPGTVLNEPTGPQTLIGVSFGSNTAANPPKANPFGNFSIAIGGVTKAITLTSTDTTLPALAADIQTQINAQNGNSDLSVNVVGNNLQFTSASGLTISNPVLNPVSTAPDGVFGGTLGQQDANGNPIINGQPMTRSFIGSKQGATDVLAKLDYVMNQVNAAEATMGSVMNRLNYVVNNLTSVSMNLTASESAISDADYASASTQLSKTQIMQQAATAVLAQANTSQQSVLKLLQG
jgi:flagellin